MAVRTSRPSRHRDGPLVVTADLELLDDVLAAAAAAGVDLTVVDDPAAIRGSWSSAPMIIVGADRAQRTAELALPHRAEVLLVGQEDRKADVERWSAPLGAAMVSLPGSAAWLTTALADVGGRGGRIGRVIGVVGGVGGVGASTLAAAIAVTGGPGGAAMVIDLDPLGGGVDLVMGAESDPGWRWPQLTSAQGHLGDLRDRLPRAGGVSVLATARGPDAFAPIGIEAVKAVLTAAARHHRLVVVDLPREPTPAALEAIRIADALLLITCADVRGVAGARQVLERLSRMDGRLTGVVVRRPRTGGIDPVLVAESLSLDLIAVVRDDPALARAAEVGEPPGKSARSVVGRAARKVVDELDRRRGPAG